MASPHSPRGRVCPIPGCKELRPHESALAIHLEFAHDIAPTPIRPIPTQGTLSTRGKENVRAFRSVTDAATALIPSEPALLRAHSSVRDGGLDIEAFPASLGWITSNQPWSASQANHFKSLMIKHQIFLPSYHRIEGSLEYNKSIALMQDLLEVMKPDCGNSKTQVLEHTLRHKMNLKIAEITEAMLLSKELVRVNGGFELANIRIRSSLSPAMHSSPSVPYVSQYTPPTTPQTSQRVIQEPSKLSQALQELDSWKVLSIEDQMDFIARLICAAEEHKALVEQLSIFCTDCQDSDFTKPRSRQEASPSSVMASRSTQTIELSSKPRILSESIQTAELSSKPRVLSQSTQTVDVPVEFEKGLISGSQASATLQGQNTSPLSEARQSNGVSQDEYPQRRIVASEAHIYTPAINNIQEPKQTTPSMDEEVVDAHAAVNSAQPQKSTTTQSQPQIPHSYVVIDQGKQVSIDLESTVGTAPASAMPVTLQTSSPEQHPPTETTSSISPVIRAPLAPTLSPNATQFLATKVATLSTPRKNSPQGSSFGSENNIENSHTNSPQLHASDSLQISHPTTPISKPISNGERRIAQDTPKTIDVEKPTIEMTESGKGGLSAKCGSFTRESAPQDRTDTESVSIMRPNFQLPQVVSRSNSKPIEKSAGQHVSPQLSVRRSPGPQEQRRPELPKAVTLSPNQPPILSVKGLAERIRRQQEMAGMRENVHHKGDIQGNSSRLEGTPLKRQALDTAGSGCAKKARSS